MQRKFEILNVRILIFKIVDYFCLKNYQTRCHKENLTDFSYCLLFNCLREWNENTYEFGKKQRKFGLFKEKISQKFDH